jgi:hypothetical protein
MCANFKRQASLEAASLKNTHTMVVHTVPSSKRLENDINIKATSSWI